MTLLEFCEYFNWLWVIFAAILFVCTLEPEEAMPLVVCLICKYTVNDPIPTYTSSVLLAIIILSTIWFIYLDYADNIKYSKEDRRNVESSCIVGLVVLSSLLVFLI